MMLFWHLPHEEQSVEQVAAPQHEAATDMTCGGQSGSERGGGIPCSCWAQPAAGEREEHPWRVVVVAKAMEWRALSGRDAVQAGDG
jgi:hypothetical protein